MSWPIDLPEGLDYRLGDNGVFRLTDNVFIPDEFMNKDWLQYQAWVDVPNTAQAQYTLAERRDRRVVELLAKLDEVSNGNVIYSTKTYSSTMDMRHCVTFLLRAVEDAELGPNVNVYDITNTAQSLAVADLISLHGLLISLMQLSWDNAETIRATIMASSDPESDSIDTGWATIPFDPA